MRATLGALAILGSAQGDRAGKVRFFQARLAPWAQAAGEIGLTPDSINHLIELTEPARAAHKAHQQAQNAAKAAALAFRNAVHDMHLGEGAGSDMIDQVRNYASRTGDPSVYAKALLPRPDTGARPGSAPPPGRPSDIDVALDHFTGALTLTWKCDNPRGTRGTLYVVQRRLGPAGPFTALGAVGVKRFTDDTLPPPGWPDGIVTYRITGQRSTKMGRPAQFTVRVGADKAVSGAQALAA